MEVTGEEAQTVLLESIEPTQYITIHRTEGDGINKSVPLLTLNGEILSEGMVVDMINAGVGQEFTSNTQYYEAADLLPHELTEEDRKLAAALVAVQLQQQQKHQQMQNHATAEDPSLSEITQLENLAPTYSIQAISESESALIYNPTTVALPYKRTNQNVKTEFINVKNEYEDNEDGALNSGPKRSLPHKKRIARKLKQQTKKSTVKKDAGKTGSQESQQEEEADEIDISPTFKCELCTSRFSTQLKFFEHLKAHYEPKITSTITISMPDSMEDDLTTRQVMEEFSEPEDLMEGIRGVVEQTGAHIDEEIEAENETLAEVNPSTNLWAISSSAEQLTKEDKQEEVEVSTINMEDLEDKPTKPKPNPPKKKTVNRRLKEDLMCKECGRMFYHKNSLVYHLRSHSGERPHQCEVCGKSFFAASALKVHKRLHSGDKPYKCEFCGRHFRQWGDLKYHCTSLHSEQKQFQCEYCGKDFARKYSLIVHRRIHTGEKNYRCEYCNKTFRASSYLQNHRRIHTGEKPHPCQVCGKPFRVRSDMKRHMHTHSREIVDKTVRRPAPRKAEPKSDKNAHAKSIRDLVRDLKLEVDPNVAVEIVSEENPETILPHEASNTQTLEYVVTSGSSNSSDRDPLGTVDRPSDSLQYFFM